MIARFRRTTSEDLQRCLPDQRRRCVVEKVWIECENISHQDVVIDPIEELLQVDINMPDAMYCCARSTA
jgi:hypothetical protein